MAALKNSSMTHNRKIGYARKMSSEFLDGTRVRKLFVICIRSCDFATQVNITNNVVETVKSPFKRFL